MSTDRASSSARGSAPAEFAMVAGVVVLLFLMLLQVSVILHVRNVAVAHALEGARLAGRSGASDEDGARRTQELLTDSLGADYAQDVRVDHGSDAGAPVVLVTVHIPLPVIGTWGIPDLLTVRGRAYDEDAS